MMAINPLPENPVFPDWFHIGFRFDMPEEIKSLYKKMTDEKSPIKAELQEQDDFVFFRCLDPTGYVVEVFWEPVPNGFAKENGAKIVSAFPIPDQNRNKFPPNEAEFSGRYSTYAKMGFKPAGEPSDFYQRMELK